MDKEQLKQRVIEGVQCDIIKTEILISYLQELKKTMNKAEKGATDVKIMALERDIKFNLGYVKHASNS